MRALYVLIAAARLAAGSDAPFSARLVVDSAYVRAAPEHDAAIVGLLRAGDEVRVLRCTVDCSAPNAWALLDGDGAIRAALLSPTGTDEPGPYPRYVYGRVRGGGVHLRAAPRNDARVIARYRSGEDLAFLDDAALRADGWLARPSGGFVRLAEIRLSAASTFAGEPAPSLPLAFALDDVHRFDREAVVDEHRQVRTTAWSLPRANVRVARARTRPTIIADDDRWIHVSLREQTLVAYEGDRAVYATLVSSGRADHPTPRGLFRVWYKEIHSPMHGEPPEPYFVDEVPFVQYFAKGAALHGTFWHARFGNRASHGCVNLSMADAEWLFEWAPPALPTGWHAIEPAAAHRQALWVLVE